MSFQRVEIKKKHVEDALKVASGEAVVGKDGKIRKVDEDGAEKAVCADQADKGIDIWADTQLPYLQIRRRRGSVKWMVRTKGTLITIGDVRERASDYLSVKAARERATAAYAQKRYGKAATPVSADEALAGWTWADLDREYQAMIAKPRWINNRKKPPSAGTCDDVRLAFARPSFTALHPKLLTELDEATIESALEQIGSYRQRQKNVAYLKAAMTWAANKRRVKSGLLPGMDRWWERLEAGEPDEETMEAIEARRAVHRQRKAELDVAAIGAVLARHEAYCAGRTAEDKISPGIRFGIWWTCLTANRRASTVKLRRDDFIAKDQLGEPDRPGWGRAAWPPAAMKAKFEFWLPLPPFVRDIAEFSMRDWGQLVANEGKALVRTEWVFASSQRLDHGDEKDRSIYPNSLNRYIQRMRKDSALDGLPHFAPHLVRSAMGDFIAEKVSGVVSSLVLAHTLPTDGEEAARTTQEYYLVSQRMREKADGMRAWTDALLNAYLKIDGAKLPEPREQRRASKIKSKKAPA